MKSGALCCLIPRKASETIGKGKIDSEINLPVLLKEPLKGATARSPIQPYRDLVIGGGVLGRKVPEVELASLIGVRGNGKQTRVRFTNVKLHPNQQPSARLYQWKLSSYRDIWYFGAIDNEFCTFSASTEPTQSNFLSSLVAFVVGARLCSGGDEAW